MRTKPDNHPRSPLPETADGTLPHANGPAPRETARQTSREIGGPKGPEPTRYGDWEVGGRCTDF